MVLAKACDEQRPVCDTCAALHINCHYNQDKPEWMDGGVRQEKMAEELKREVKEKAHLRRGGRTLHTSGDRVSVAEAVDGAGKLRLPPQLPTDVATSVHNLFKASSNDQDDRTEPCLRRGTDATLACKDAGESGNITFGQSDTVLIMFYLENLFPFLFPFYRPSVIHGGRAWILEMMIKSPVMRQATLCQSSYFFSLAHGMTSRDVVWETVLKQTRDAFGVLGQALQVIDGSEITDHLPGAVRIMASIMQIQRFEIAISSFGNCQSHLNAALALFKQVLDSSGAVDPARLGSSFNTIMSRLKPSWSYPACQSQYLHVPSAEQAAFRFSSALLIFDDIIASTVLPEEPRLYEYHCSLLGDIDSTGPPINLEAVVGCQNWALLQISDISVLDAWKQQCKRAGSLDVMELVHRATAIKGSLETQFARLESDPVFIPKEGSSLLDVFTADYGQHPKPPVSQNLLVTRVWAHAARLYLFIVVSGWQPASIDVRYHVARIIELLSREISPSALLRTMVWPFCVAGCLAEPAQEAQFRGMVDGLQPPSVFGTIRKALEIMEGVWGNRDAGDAANRDLATCFGSQGDLVLLV
ncbi:Pestheic acid cluster transcriptional regulator 3 [Lachnellula cervina]|uniref:Pestheic acid cluster transcriptional regulator 3 n=1 Tax=Lachnellula cervina TaxID=1316786 RepID=A0A7D8UZ65_9HELO|nr:Pestheic acid cluster transcriptional regulator 3 [Lachnellula cervina]